MDSFVNGLDANQRAILIDIQEGHVAAGTITVKAEDLLNLFQAHGAVETVRAKRAEKTAKEGPASCPGYAGTYRPSTRANHRMSAEGSVWPLGAPAMTSNFQEGC